MLVSVWRACNLWAVFRELVPSPSPGADMVSTSNQVRKLALPALGGREGVYVGMCHCLLLITLNFTVGEVER